MSGTGHVSVSSTKFRRLRHVFTQLATGAPATRPLSTRHLLAHLCSSSFCTLFSASHLSSSSTVHSQAGGNVFTERGLKLKPSNLRAQFMHLEYRNPSLLNECVHLLSVGCVCRHHAAPSQFCHSRLLVEPIASSSVVRAKPVFPSRHPFLSVVLMRLSRLLSKVGCQATHLLQRWESDAASQHPSALHSAVLHQIFRTFPIGAACSTEQHSNHHPAQGVCEVV